MPGEAARSAARTAAVSQSGGTAGGDAIPDDAAARLFQELHTSGYVLGVDQQVAVLRLLADESLNRNKSTARLKRRLTPLIAKDAASQTEVAALIGTVFGAEQRGLNRERNLLDRAEDARRRRQERQVKGRRLLAALAAVGLAAASVWQVYSVWFGDALVELTPVDVGLPEGVQDPGPIDLDPRVEFPAPGTVIAGLQEPSPLRPFAIGLVFAAPMAAFTIWALRRRRKRRDWLATVDHTLNAPDEAMAADFDLGSVPIIEGMRRAARNLQNPLGSGGAALDLRRSIRATARQAGFFTPMPRGRSAAADLVVLVERKTVHDHVARMADAILDRIEAAGVRIRSFHYNDDPRLSRRREDQSSPGFSNLMARFGEHRFVVIGSSDGFFHPVTGELMDWANAFTELTSSALLNARPVGYRSYQEQELRDLGFWMNPASPTAMAAYGDAVATGRDRVAGRTSVRSARSDRQTVKYPPLSLFQDSLDNGDLGPTMIVMPAGSFLMGSPEDEAGRDDNEGPQRLVSFSRTFALARDTTTFEEFDAFCIATGRDPPQDVGWGRGRRPVINVSWNEANEYCAWLSERAGARYRLPSEAEWEYACRAGTSTPHAFEITGGRTNFDRKGTVPVDELDAANAWGLRHMHGNVCEWVDGEYSKTLAVIPADGSSWRATNGQVDALRVVRGGSWSNIPRYLRSAGRFRIEPGIRDYFIGFRPARTLTL